MALRSRHLVAAGGLAAVALLWASRDAWPWRRPLTAAPIVVSTAYHDSALTLGSRETLGQLLQRAGITGRDWAAFLGAATALQPRRLRPGLLFHVRRLVTDSLPDRLMVRTGPAQRLWVERSAAGWTQRVETIPWTIQRVRVVGLIESSLYDALDQAVPDSFLPAVERRQLAWAIADVYDWEVDFTRDVQRGDRFEVLLERLESPEGERRFGRIRSSPTPAKGERGAGGAASTTTAGGRSNAPSCARRCSSVASRAASAAASTRFSTSGARTRVRTTPRRTAPRCARQPTGS